MEDEAEQLERELTASFDAVLSGQAPPKLQQHGLLCAAEGMLRHLERQEAFLALYRLFLAHGRVVERKEWAQEGIVPSVEAVDALFGDWERFIAETQITSLALPAHLMRLRSALRRRRQADVARSRAIGARENELAARAERLDRDAQTLQGKLEQQFQQQLDDAQRALSASRRELEEMTGERQALESSLVEARRQMADREQEQQDAAVRAHALTRLLAERDGPISPVWVSWLQFPGDVFKALADAVAAGIARGALCQQISMAGVGVSEWPLHRGVVEVDRSREDGPLSSLRVCHSQPLLDQGREGQPGRLLARRELTVTVWRDQNQVGVLTEITVIEADPVIPERELADLSGRLMGVARPADDAGWPVGRSATRVGRDEVGQLDAFLRESARSRPVLVLTTDKQGSMADNLDELAAAMCGAAHVVCLSVPATHLLSELVGRERSVWGGQARCYQPGFSKEAPPGIHPLLDPRRYGSPKAFRNAVFALASRATGSQTQARSLRFEVDPDREEDPLESLQQQAAQLERERDQQSQIAAHLAQALASGDRAETPTLIASVAEAAALARRDARHLHFAPRAFRSAGQTSYRPAKDVYDALMALDHLAGEYEQGEIGQRLIDRAAQLGLTMRGDVSLLARTKYASHYQAQYEELTIPLAAHLILATGIGADRTCRVYLHLADGQQQLPRGIYVGHIGRHLPDGNS